jgi:hypothetical protein
MKVAIYSSIPNKKSRDTENQFAEIRLHAQSKHCEVHLFVDREPGKTSDPVEVRKLFEYATRREFQFVLVVGPGSLHRRKCGRSLRERPEAGAVRSSPRLSNSYLAGP